MLGAGNIAMDKTDPGLAFIKFIVKYFSSEPALALLLNQVSLGLGAHYMISYKGQNSFQGGAGTSRQKQAQKVFFGEGELTTEIFDIYNDFFMSSTTMTHELLDREMKNVFIIGHKVRYFVVYIPKKRVKST